MPSSSEGGVPAAYRPVWAEIDLGAVRANVRALRELCDPARLLAVVKADAYGHGAVPLRRAALEAGAVGLGVALVEEGIELREAGIDAPILVLSEPRARSGVERGGATVSRRSSTRSAGSTRWPRPSPIAVRATGSRCTSRSTPACTVSAVAPKTRSSSPPRWSIGPSSSSAACARTSPWPTSPTTRTRPTSSRASTKCSPRAAPRGSADRHRPRRATTAGDRMAGRRASTWCESASDATASHPPTSSTVGSSCGPRCR